MLEKGWEVRKESKGKGCVGGAFRNSIGSLQGGLSRSEQKESIERQKNSTHSDMSAGNAMREYCSYPGGSTLLLVE